MYIKKEKLEVIHNIQIEMVKELKRICELYDIDYFIIAGTLLGAVRHNGFIPWDDDIDIGMLREDYDEFMMAAKTELSQDYFLQDWNSDKNYGLPFAKIRKNNTMIVEEMAAKTNTHFGVFIDIFPFDNVPNNNLQRKKQEIVTYIFKRLVLVKNRYEPWLYEENRFKKIYIKL